MELDVRTATLLERALGLLELPPLAGEVLRAFLPMEVDPESAAQRREDDPQGRAGVISWNALCDELLATDPPHQSLPDVSELEASVVALATWGIVQIVGQSASDPPVSGSAALRLTFAGRIALGLAPATRTDLPPSPPSPWIILHGASREALLLEAWQRLGTAGEAPGEATRLAPLVLGPRAELSEVVSTTTARLLTDGLALVDTSALLESEHPWSAAGVLEGLLTRTRRARAPRLLLVSDPAAIRVAARLAGAIMFWVEPAVQARRAGLVLDRRFTEGLRAGRRGAAALADLSGVPDSEIAMPQRVNTSWDDLLLPASVQLEFRQARWNAEFRLDLTVADRPGRSFGYRLLLSGLPGTGKSMAAEALATTLGRPLVRLDLSSVLSKWLGETEKLLAQVFDVAEAADAVVVLDEAESLLRQRESGASGGHALATGVAYLLTRLDRFSGVLVATTNRTKDLDEAFFRRFDDFIVLPVPDEPTRALLWRRHLGPPPADLPIDLDLIARRFAISGGLIRGASLRARAWAVGLGEPISTPLVLASLGRELEKSDRSSKEVLIEPFSQRVEELMRGGTTSLRPVEVRTRARTFGRPP